MPKPGADEARAFFANGVEAIAAAYGAERDDPRSFAVRVIATLEGAMLVARGLGDPTVFDAATTEFAPAGPG